MCSLWVLCINRGYSLWVLYIYRGYSLWVLGPCVGVVYKNVSHGVIHGISVSIYVPWGYTVGFNLIHRVSRSYTVENIFRLLPTVYPYVTHGISLCLPRYNIYDLHGVYKTTPTVYRHSHSVNCVVHGIYTLHGISKWLWIYRGRQLPHSIYPVPTVYNIPWGTFAMLPTVYPHGISLCPTVYSHGI